MAEMGNGSLRIEHIPLDKIVDSPYNDRTEFDQEKLEELAQSLRSMGVMMPILVRPKGEMYERIYGERRYRAAQLAELKTIPAYVKELDDKEAQELSTAENFFREDLTPLEVATALERYIKRGYTVEDIVATFGFRKTSVRLALKLNDLLPALKELLKERHISLGIARELMQYPKNIQKEVYENHFADESSGQSWRQITVEKFRKIMKEAYTNDLNVYAFDKTDCANCENNTNCSMLFPEENDAGRCTKTSCLLKRNKEYIVEKVNKEAFAIKNSIIAYDDTALQEVVEEIGDMGYEVFSLDSIDDIFLDPGAEPIAPNREDYEEESDFMDAVSKHDQELTEYVETRQQFEKDLKDGILQTVIVVKRFDIFYIYRFTPKEEESIVPVQTEIAAGEESTGEPAEKTVKEINAPLISSLQERLTNIAYKLNRNAVQRKEKLVDQTKYLFRHKTIKTPVLSKNEEGIFYTVLMDQVRPEHYTLLGLKKGQAAITEENKKKVAAKLTPKRKAIIMRDYMVSQVLAKASGESLESEMLLDLAGEHFPDDLKQIEEEVDKSFVSKDSKLEEEMEKLKRELELLEKENEMFENEQEQSVPQAAEDIEDSTVEQEVLVPDTSKERLLLPAAAIPDENDKQTVNPAEESGIVYPVLAQTEPQDVAPETKPNKADSSSRQKRGKAAGKKGLVA